MYIPPRPSRYLLQTGKIFTGIVVLAISLVSFCNAAQRDQQGERLQKENRDDDTKVEQHGIVTVEVIMVDSKNSGDRRPVAGAAVHIEGGEEPRKTNEKGRVRFPGVPTGRLSLQVVLNDIDVGPCKVTGINVSQGEQVVTIEFDKSQKNNCRRTK